jgi:hypothetical protein
MEFILEYDHFQVMVNYQKNELMNLKKVLGLK